MQHEQGFLDNGLYWQCWRPEASPRGVVLLAHGLAEHGGRYAHVAGALGTLGLATYAPDHKGHGKTPGRRCVIERFSDFTDGVDAMFETIRQRHAGLPVVILGHSMGGLIAATSVIEHPGRYHAAVLTGPAVLPPEMPPAWQEKLVRFLSRWWPTAGVVSLDAEAISRDPAVVQRYFDDPLVYNGKVPARLAAELFAAMDALRANGSAITLPLLVMHGSADRLTAPAGSVLLVEAADSADKTLIEPEAAFHELFNEPDQQNHIGTMLRWLDERL